MKAMFVETNPIPVKAATAQLGLTGAEIRLPLVAASDATNALLESLLKELAAAPATA